MVEFLHQSGKTMCKWDTVFVIIYTGTESLLYISYLTKSWRSVDPVVIFSTIFETYEDQKLIFMHLL